MNSNDIRKTFLAFFEKRGHHLVRSSSLVPANDPTLLFSNAGMNQFKDVFLGRERRDYTRACSSQKCVRAGGKHNDLEQVGRTTRHHTFFEMLGNFSFGDYFKAEAIPWAWELITQDFAIPKDKLYATVFREDDDAEEIWAKIVPRERIFRCDEKDNFWQMGDTGPCGPCSEIHYDLGPAASDLGHKDCKFPCPEDCGRYVEIWNLVFMQFNRDESGKMTPLPRPSIDTGAGLERLAAVLQGKVSNFDTDLFRPLIEEAAELANVEPPFRAASAGLKPGATIAKEYGANHETDVSLRIIADHARAATFLISDGVLPSNEGRGYVLRRIVRRGIEFGRVIDLKGPFLFRLAGKVVELMRVAYPELLDSHHAVAAVIKKEEENYSDNVAEAILIFEHRITPKGDWPKKLADLRDYHGKQPREITGEDLFFAYDTLGLRPDFLRDAAQNRGWKFFPTAEEEFQRLLEEQRKRGRASWKAETRDFYSAAHAEEVEFVGYHGTELKGCKILSINNVTSHGNLIQLDDQLEIVLDKTPFYAEAGGQVGDTGWFLDPRDGQKVVRVTDTKRSVGGQYYHCGVALRLIGLGIGEKVTAVVDSERRDSIRRNHTATHLLHAALRNALGTHVKQAGSLVPPDRLRFDFSHYAPLGEQDVLDIEDLVNEHVLKNEEVNTDVMDLDAAINSGAMALFGEKYGDKVRVVSIADGSFSKELCGGTHVRRTGDIGLFKIISESSVAAGTRRIEALTGQGVLEHLRKASGTLALLGQTLRAKPDELLEAAEKLAESEKKLRKQLEAQQMKRAASEAGDLVEQAREVKGVRVVSARVDVTDLHGQEGRAAMRQMVDSLRPKLGSGVIALGSVADGKVTLIVGVTQDMTAKLDAGKIVREAAKIVEGSGGGRKDLAEAGGKNPERLDESLAAVPGIVERML